jgi:hypothetical protein
MSVQQITHTSASLDFASDRAALLLLSSTLACCTLLSLLAEVVVVLVVLFLLLLLRLLLLLGFLLLLLLLFELLLLLLFLPAARPPRLLFRDLPPRALFADVVVDAVVVALVAPAVVDVDSLIFKSFRIFFVWQRQPRRNISRKTLHNVFLFYLYTTNISMSDRSQSSQRQKTDGTTNNCVIRSFFDSQKLSIVSFQLTKLVDYFELHLIVFRSFLCLC